MFYLGWIVAAFLAGVLLAQRRKPTLQQRVFRIGVFAGRSYAEILRKLEEPQAETRQADGRTLRTWRNRDYSISLLFDERGMCLGVQDEGH